MREADLGQGKGTPLKRVQVIKGWLNLDGEPVRKVFDVAGDPNNGASLDLDTCEATGEGFDTLSTGWSDPGIDKTIQERAWTSPIWYQPVVR